MKKMTKNGEDRIGKGRQRKKEESDKWGRGGQ